MVAGGRELIDTLWNVNTIGFDNGIIKMRINRYIMECKFRTIDCKIWLTFELIDTLWNVNVTR